MTAVHLRCPRCSFTLIDRTSPLVCTTCGTRYTTRNGVVDLRLECPREEEPLLQQSDDADWPALVRAYVANADAKAEALYEATASGRTAWKLLLDLHPEATVLDLGSGTGLVASSVAPHVSRLVALDFSIRPLLMAASRFRKINPDDRIEAILTDRNCDLPFPDHTFDCVLAAAPVHWTPPDGESPGSENKLRHTQNQLAAIGRVLKPDGQLFWVAENRLGHDKWLVALRRFLQHQVIDHGATDSSLRLSYFGYGRALRRTGFTSSRWFGLQGTVSFLSAVQPLETRLGFWRPPRPKGLRSRLDGIRYTARQYGILSSRQALPDRSVLERLLDKVQKDLDNAAPARLRRFAISRKEKVILTIDGSETSLIVRIPLSPAAHESEQRNLRMLRALATQNAIHGIIPRCLHRGRSGSVDFFVETFVSGRPLSSRLADVGAETANETARALLDRIHGFGFSPPLRELSGDRFHSEVGVKLSSLGRFGVSTDVCLRLEDFFRQRLYGARLPFGLLHGDFSPSNILLDQHDTVSGLIDWEGGSEDSLSILDAIHYVECVERRWTRTHIGAVVPRMAEGIFSNEDASELLTERYEQWRIDPALHEALVYLKWLRHMHHLSQFWLAYDQRSIETVVMPVAQSILKRNTG